MSIDKLIGNLCDDLEPVNKIPHPLKCMSGWLLFASAMIGGMIFYMGLRHDIESSIKDPLFLFEMTLMAALAISAIIATFWMRVPDMRGMKWIVPVPYVLFGVFVVWMFIRIITENIDMPHMEFHHCMRDGILIAALPGFVMFFSCLRGCTTHPIKMIFMNAFALGSIVYASLRLTCASEDVSHLLYTHILPFVVIGTVAGLLARRFYKW